MSLLLVSEIIRLFFHTLTADDKYSLLIRNKLLQPIRMQLPKKQKIFFELFDPFLKSKLNFQHFEKNMTPIAYVFLKLENAKRLVT